MSCAFDKCFVKLEAAYAGRDRLLALNAEMLKAVRLYRDDCADRSAEDPYAAETMGWLNALIAKAEAGQ